METTILIIVSFTLITSLTFFYFYFKTVKEHLQIYQQRFDKSMIKLDELQNLLQKEVSELKTSNNSTLNILTKVIDELKQAVLNDIEKLATNYENQNKQVIEKLSANLNEVIKSSKEFKEQLSEAQQQTLKSIQAELNKILNEIKSPLEDEPN